MDRSKSTGIMQLIFYSRNKSKNHVIYLLSVQNSYLSVLKVNKTFESVWLPHWLKNGT